MQGREFVLPASPTLRPHPYVSELLGGSNLRSCSTRRWTYAPFPAAHPQRSKSLVGNTRTPTRGRPPYTDRFQERESGHIPALTAMPERRAARDGRGTVAVQDEREHRTRRSGPRGPRIRRRGLPRVVRGRAAPGPRRTPDQISRRFKESNGCREPMGARDVRCAWPGTSVLRFVSRVRSPVVGHVAAHVVGRHRFP